MRLRPLGFAAIAMVAMGIAFVATPAQAAEKPRHCVANASDANAPIRCYDSFTTAIAKATGGRVTDAPDNARAALKDARLAAQLNATSTKQVAATIAPQDRASLAANIVVSIEYWDSGFGGSTYTWTAPWGCTGTTSDTDWEAATLQSNWNDEIGSYRGYANCWVKHFEHIYFSGISTAYDGGLADMGWMDDETSSIRWS